jgi:hypothetical protein
MAEPVVDQPVTNSPEATPEITRDAAEAAGVVQPVAAVEPAAAGAPATNEAEVADGTADAKGAPESYGEFVLPDGVEMSETYAKEFADTARGLDLSQEQAQAMLDLQAVDYQRAQEADAQEWDNLQRDWQTASAKDQEIGGGSEQAFKENIAIANKAVAAYGGEELAQALLDTGAGNHPEVVRFFLRVGKALSEDGAHSSIAKAQPGKPAEPDIGSVFFPNSNMK